MKKQCDQGLHYFAFSQHPCDRKKRIAQNQMEKSTTKEVGVQVHGDFMV